MYLFINETMEEKEIEELYYIASFDSFENIVDVLKDFFITKKIPKTYTNKDCTKLQCREQRNRSIDDLFLIIKRYFPEVTIEDLISSIVEFSRDLANNNTINWRIFMFKCSTIARPVFYSDTLVGSKLEKEIFYESSIRDKNKGNSKWTIKELVEIYDKLVIPIKMEVE